MLIARRRTASARIYPTPTSGTACVTPTPDGTGYIIHPSVVDMGPQEWNGFRWWRLDTPYANQSGAQENPCIYGSNDRINWEVPAGLTNPIDPWPGPAAGLLTLANSDVELLWDPDGQRMVAYWREGGGKLYAESSYDGITWLPHGIRSGIINNRSPGIARGPDGQWRMLTFGPEMYVAPHILGPWTAAATPVGMSVPGRGAPYHGDLIHHAGRWLAIFSTTGTRDAWPAISDDGTTWRVGSALPFGSYRPTMCPAPEAGYMDVWASDPSRYYQVPMSAWLDIP